MTLFLPNFIYRVRQAGFFVLDKSFPFDLLHHCNKNNFKPCYNLESISQLSKRKLPFTEKSGLHSIIIILSYFRTNSLCILIISLAIPLKITANF